MTERRKGIVDPWRQPEPLHPVIRERPVGKKDLEDIDFDADLAIPGKYVLRVKGAALDVTSVRIETPNDALEVIADCLIAMWRVKSLAQALVALAIGVRTPRIALNIPNVPTAASRLESVDASIWFMGVTLDEGVAALSRLMRSSDAKPIVQKFGITPMLTA